jgi:hypothetical protein
MYRLGRRARRARVPTPNENSQNELPSAAPTPLLPPNAVGEDGWPGYLMAADKDLSREDVADDEQDEAQNYLDSCRYEYEPLLRKRTVVFSSVPEGLSLIQE